jgi:hypothetical protein
MVQFDPNLISEEGAIVGFASTPAIRVGDAVLVYVRMNDGEVDTWRGTPGVNILVETPYVGPTTPDVLYNLLQDDEGALATYNQVYPELEGRPFRFGQMG